MAVALSNWDGTMQFTAPAGGVTAYNLNVTATTLIACVPLQTATSGNTYTGRIYGVVQDVTKSSATAFLAGAALSIGTAGVAVAVAASGITNAYAYGDATSTNTVMDVLLVPPISAA
jgi:hypothetical protein